MNDFGGRRSPPAEIASTEPVETMRSPTISSYGHHAPSVLTMPLLGSKSAPKKFSGKADKLKAFLKQFERLADLHGLTPLLKCTTIGDYCSQRVKETIEGFSSYRRGDWATLKDEIESVYDIESVTKKYTLQDLWKLCRTTAANGSIKKLKHWKEYVQDFVRIGGALQANERITDIEYATYFWLGIPEKTQTRLELSIRNKLPDHDMSTPFPVSIIQRAAEDLLHRDRFDRARILWNPITEDDGEELSDSDSDFSDSDDEDIKTQLRRLVKKKDRRSKSRASSITLIAPDKEKPRKESTPRTRSKITDPSAEKPKTKTVDQMEVESIIKQMSKMKISDPAYSLLYYQAIKLDGEAAKCLQSPARGGTAPPAPTPSGPRNPPPSNFGNRMDRPPRNFQDRGFSSGCYGCGENGHVMSVCPKIQTYIDKRKVVRDSFGRFSTISGKPIHRGNAPHWIAAFEALPLESLFIEVNNDYSDEETVNVLASQYGTRSKGPPPPADAAPDNSQKTRAPRRITKPVEPTPVDAIPSRFDPTREDAIMEDLTAPANKAPPPQAANRRTAEYQPPRAFNRTLPRQSEISRQVPPMTLINKVLNTPMTVSVGEMIGSSKEIAAQLQNLLRYRQNQSDENAPRVEVRSNLVEKLQHPLIRLPMSCHGVPGDFILDSGSEINIISEDMWKQLKIPINRRKRASIRDANDGRGDLEGSIKNLTLSCGHVDTFGDFYVSKTAPFDGLLGRPWHSQNQITVSDRTDGTHILFPPMDQEDIDSEIIVGTPEPSEPTPWWEDEQMRAHITNRNRSAAVYLTEVDRASDTELTDSTEPDIENQLAYVADETTDVASEEEVSIKQEEIEIDMTKEDWPTSNARQDDFPIPLPLETVVEPYVISVLCDWIAGDAQLMDDQECNLITKSFWTKLEIPMIFDRRLVSLNGNLYWTLGRVMNVFVTNMDIRAKGLHDFFIIEDGVSSTPVILGHKWLETHGLRYKKDGLPDYQPFLQTNPIPDVQLLLNYLPRYDGQAAVTKDLLCNNYLTSVRLDPNTTHNCITIGTCKKLRIPFTTSAEAYVLLPGRKLAPIYGETSCLSIGFGVQPVYSKPSRFFIVEDAPSPVVVGADWLYDNGLIDTIFSNPNSLDVEETVLRKIQNMRLTARVLLVHGVDIVEDNGTDSSSTGEMISAPSSPPDETSRIEELPQEPEIDTHSPEAPSSTPSDEEPPIKDLEPIATYRVPEVDDSPPEETSPER